MKAIPLEELAPLSGAIHADASRIGCEHVRVSSAIWIGGQATGRAGEELRVVEYSWKKAALLKGEAIFEDDDPAAYAALLQAYGLGEESYPDPEEPAAVAAPREHVTINVTVLTGTKDELERRAAEAGLPLGEWLDREFAPRR